MDVPYQSLIDQPDSSSLSCEKAENRSLQRKSDCDPTTTSMKDEEDESWNDYNEKGPWKIPEGAAWIVKQIAAEQIFWEMVDQVVVDESRRADHAQLTHLIRQYPGLCHRTFIIQWDQEDETRELYPLAILACLQPPDVDLLEFMYQAYPDALHHKESVKGTMPFHYACTFQASLQVVDWMIRKDPSFVQIPRRDGMYPLHLAIFFKSPMNVVDRLLEEWPEAAERDYEGEWSILHAASAGQASLSLVKRVYELNPESALSLDERRRTPLHQACWKRGNLPVVQYLVQCAPQALSMEDDSTETPLFRASRNQSLEVMQFLLSALPRNEDDDFVWWEDQTNNTETPPPYPPLDDLGATLLHFAALDNTEDVVEYLLQNYPEMATVQTHCRDRYTPMHSACHYNSTARHLNTTSSRKPIPSRPYESSNLANFQAMVRYCPQVLTLSNGDGKTPLETAKEVGSAQEIIDFLTKVTPPKKPARSPTVCPLCQRKSGVCVCPTRHPSTFPDEPL